MIRLVDMLLTNGKDMLLTNGIVDPSVLYRQQHPPDAVSIFIPLHRDETVFEFRLFSRKHIFRSTSCTVIQVTKGPFSPI